MRTRFIPILEDWELALLVQSYDIVGDIAIVRIPRAVESRMQDIAKAICQINKHVRTVLLQVGPVSGDLRLRELKWVFGEKKTETVHKESGCVFKVDLEKCYFSPRLSFERMRIAKAVKPGETIVNMFSGVGSFSITIAKYAAARRIYSIDLNSEAIKYSLENARLNKVVSLVESINGDAKEVIEQRLQCVANRVLMPLPGKACEYLDSALLALKPGLGVLHYYDFERASKHEDPVTNAAERISSKLQNLAVDFEVSFGRVVRTVGPRWYQVVLDLSIRK